MRKLKFDHMGTVVEAEMAKVDRSKLYGSVNVRSVDQDGSRACTASLAADGRTLAGKGGIGLGVLSVDGEWIARSDLTPVNQNGEKISQVESSFSAPITLSAPISVDDYMSHLIRSTYQLHMPDCALLQALRQGAIFRFDYSYRGGLTYDAAFLMTNASGTPFMLVGDPAQLEMVGLSQEASPEEDPQDEDDEDDDLDFSMM